jgi:hypothetical protein
MQYCLRICLSARCILVSRSSTGDQDARAPGRLSNLHAQNANGRWTHDFHRVAGLAEILLFMQGASKQGFREQGSCRVPASGAVIEAEGSV